jgi:hypothetical protein
MSPSTVSGAGPIRLQGPGSQLRRMFDKVMRDENTSFVASSDGPKFMKAMVQCFGTEPVDLLYRLTHPRVSHQPGDRLP